jgi:hypothetical protein
LLLFNVTPFDFNAPIPAFHKFFNSVRKKSSFVASLTSFAPRQFLQRIVTANETLVHHYEPESKAQIWLGNARHHPWLRNSKINRQPVRLCLQFFGMWKMRFGFISFQRVKPLTEFYMFGSMKEALRGRRFSSDEEVIGAVQNWLKTQPKTLFF